MFFAHFVLSMSFGKVVTLNTGATIPQIGLGTVIDSNNIENVVRPSYRCCGSPLILLARSTSPSEMDIATST